MEALPESTHQITMAFSNALMDGVVDCPMNRQLLYSMLKTGDIERFAEKLLANDTPVAITITHCQLTEDADDWTFKVNIYKRAQDADGHWHFVGRPMLYVDEIPDNGDQETKDRLWTAVKTAVDTSKGSPGTSALHAKISLLGRA